MERLFNESDAVDAGYLQDWYIHSVVDGIPVWTEEHIEELVNDFILIPKSDKKSATENTSIVKNALSEISCDIGTIVYYWVFGYNKQTNNYCYYISSDVVVGIHIQKDMISYATELKGFTNDDIGKTIFLSDKEAKQAFKPEDI